MPKKNKNTYDGIGLYRLEKYVSAENNWNWPYEFFLIKVIVSYTKYGGKEHFTVFVGDSDDQNLIKSFENREKALEEFNQISDGITPQELFEKGYS